MNFYACISVRNNLIRTNNSFERGITPTYIKDKDEIIQIYNYNTRLQFLWTSVSSECP